MKRNSIHFRAGDLRLERAEGAIRRPAEGVSLHQAPRRRAKTY